MENDKPRRDISRLCWAYLIVTGSLFLSIRFGVLSGTEAISQGFAVPVAGLFPVVANTNFCLGSSSARSLFVAGLAVATHFFSIALIILVLPNQASEDSTSWRRAQPTLKEAVRVMRRLLKNVALGSFGCLVYWFTFFDLGKPVAGFPSSASYLCWGSGSIWLLFSLQAAFAVGVVAGVIGDLYIGIRAWTNQDLRPLE